MLTPRSLLPCRWSLPFPHSVGPSSTSSATPTSAPTPIMTPCGSGTDTSGASGSAPGAKAAPKTTYSNASARSAARPRRRSFAEGVTLGELEAAMGDARPGSAQRGHHLARHETRRAGHLIDDLKPAPHVGGGVEQDRKQRHMPIHRPEAFAVRLMLRVIASRSPQRGGTGSALPA